MPPEVKSISLKRSCACRDELQRACSQYECDPSAIVRHDPSFSQAVPTSLQNPSGMSYKDNAELYRIQTEETWGHWIWLVAELIPHGKPNCIRYSGASVLVIRLLEIGTLTAPHLVLSHVSINLPPSAQRCNTDRRLCHVTGQRRVTLSCMPICFRPMCQQPEQPNQPLLPS